MAAEGKHLFLADLSAPSGSSDQVRATLTLRNSLGLHARAAALWVQTVGRFKSEVSVLFEGQRVDGKSVLELMTLGAPQGSVLQVEAKGEDARELVAALKELAENRFYEE